MKGIMAFISLSSSLGVSFFLIHNSRLLLSSPGYCAAGPIITFELKESPVSLYLMMQPTIYTRLGPEGDRGREGEKRRSWGHDMFIITSRLKERLFYLYLMMQLTP